MIRVLVVDGKAEVRRGLRMRMAAEQDMTVVGEAANPEQALTQARALVPDVILVDIEMRGADGVELVRCLLAAVPTAAAAVLTLHGDEDTRARAQEAGAQAFLEKYGGAADLLGTIRRLASGRSATEETTTGSCAMRRASVG